MRLFATRSFYLRYLSVFVVCLLGQSVWAADFIGPQKIKVRDSTLAAMSLEQALDLIETHKTAAWLLSPKEICVRQVRREMEAEYHEMPLRNLKSMSLIADQAYENNTWVMASDLKHLSLAYRFPGMVSNECSMQISYLEHDEALRVAVAFKRLAETPPAQLQAKIDEIYSVDVANMPVEERFLTEDVSFERGIELINQYIEELALEQTVEPVQYDFDQSVLSQGVTYSAKYEASSNGKKTSESESRFVIEPGRGDKMAAEISTHSKSNFNGKEFASDLQMTCEDSEILRVASSIAERCEWGDATNQYTITKSYQDYQNYFPLTLGQILKRPDTRTSKTVARGGSSFTTNEESDYYEACYPHHARPTRIAAGTFELIEMSCAVISVSRSKNSFSSDETQTISKQLVQNWVSPEYGFVMKSDYVFQITVQIGAGSPAPTRSFGTLEVTDISLP